MVSDNVEHTSGAPPKNEQTVGDLRPFYQTRSFVAVFLLGIVAMLLGAYMILAPVLTASLDLRTTTVRAADLSESTGDIAAPGPASALEGGPLLRLAVSPLISPERAFERYHALINYLASKLNRTPVLLLGKCHSEVEGLVRYQRCDLALVDSYAFVRGQRDFGLELLAAPQVGGEALSQAYVVVLRSSPAQSLLDLRSRRFAFCEFTSYAGWLYPTIWLMDHQQDPGRFFSESLFAESHDQALLAVVHRYADGAAVDRDVYERMASEDGAIRAQTRILDTSPPFGASPLVVHPKIDPALRSQLLAILLDMHGDPKGQAVLALLPADRFVVPDDGAYDGIRRAALTVEGLE